MKPTKEQVIAWSKKACGDPAWDGGVEWTWDEVQRFAVLVYEAGSGASLAAKDQDPKLALWNFKYNRLAGPSDDRAEVAVIRKREWVGITYEEQEELVEASHSIRDAINRTDWKLREKNT